MNSSAAPKPSLLRGTSVVAALTLLSRVLGFFREVLVARLFGASAIADTYFIALRIPNMLRSIFAEGALTSAFIPVFAKEIKAGSKEAHAAFKSIASALLISTGTITALGIIYSKQIVSVVAPGFSTNAQQFELAVSLTQIMFPYLMCVSLITLFNGALNSVYIFGISAWAQVVMNLTLIVGAYLAAFYQQTEAAYFLAISVVVGGVLQVVTQMPALKRAHFPLFFLGNPFSHATWSVIVLMIPAILGAKLYQLTIFINTQLASSLEAGSVAWLSYADRLVQLPVGVVTIALSSVLLPTLAAKAVDGDHHAFGRSLIDSLRFTVFIMIPATVGLFIFAQPIVTLLLQRGAFDLYAASRTAMVTKAYAVGLVPVSLHALLVRALQARKDTVTPTLLGLVTLVLTLLFSLLLAGDLPRLTDDQFSIGILQLKLFNCLHFIGLDSVVSYMTTHPMGASGLALGSSLAMSSTALICGLVVARRNSHIPWTIFFTAALKTLLASLIAGVAILYIPIHPLMQMAGYCLLLLALLKLLKVREYQETFLLISRYLPYGTRRN